MNIWRSHRQIWRNLHWNICCWYSWSHFRRKFCSAILKSPRSIFSEMFEDISCGNPEGVQEKSGKGVVKMYEEISSKFSAKNLENYFFESLLKVYGKHLKISCEHCSRYWLHDKYELKNMNLDLKNLSVSYIIFKSAIKTERCDREVPAQNDYSCLSLSRSSECDFGFDRVRGETVC